MAHARGCTLVSFIDRLPPDLLAEIRGRLGFVDRLAFAAACSAQSRRLIKAEAPCLVLPAVAPERVTIFSLNERQAAAAGALDPAMRDHVVLGSSAGWLVTADTLGTLRMANPVTGEQAELPAITTIPFLSPLSSGGWFLLRLPPFAEVRFGRENQTAHQTYGGAWLGGMTYTHAAAEMRLWFYRKVVLSASPSPRSYAAMLILRRRFGAPAFATSENPVWRLAPSRDGIEDAIHHNGKFYSITYSGAVEAWDRDCGGGDTSEFVSKVAAPKVAFEERHLSRKYLAAAPDGRLMAVLKYSSEELGGGYHSQYYETPKVKRVSFKVQVLDEARGRWEETADIGEAALFVGVNGSLCVSTREYRGMRAGCLYFTDDDVGQAWLRRERRNRSVGEFDDKVWDVGVYSLQSGKAERIVALQKHPWWPPPAWFTPPV